MPHSLNDSENHKFLKIGIGTCILILIARLITLPILDLIDSTEGRYAAAAVIMMERGDYLTPWIDMGNGFEPYLGKPPMHFWLTVGCFKAFGISAFSARLPSFLATVLCAGLLFWFARRVWSTRVAVQSTLFYLTSGITFFLAGAAVLDTTLMLFDTTAIILFGGYYLCGLHNRPRLTSALIGAALSAAFLTKGPVSIAIFLAAVLPWAFVHKNEVLSKKFPLVTCLLSFTIFTVPWYLLCELHHPGFLYYFIVKENLLRVVSDNYGDRYGTGHPQVLGTSFLHAFLCFMPWSLVLLAYGISALRQKSFPIKKWLSLTTLRLVDSPLLFVVSWSISMPLFLLFTSQYTANYLAPIMPGLALLLAGIVKGTPDISSLRLPKWASAILVKTFGAIALALPLVGVLLDAPWWIIPLCWLLAGSFFYFAIFKRVINSELRIYRNAGLLSIFYSIVIFSFFTYVSSRRSTAEVISLIAKQPEVPTNRAVVVGFVGRPPFSSAVYGTISTPRIEMKGVAHVGATPDKFDYYINTRKMAASGYALPPTAVQIAQTSKWTVYQSRSSTPSDAR